MKWIAICLNAAFLVTVFCLLANEPWHSPGAEEIFIFFLVFATPISSLAALFFIGGESWLSLYLKRKTLEEKDKIEKLRGQQNRTGTSNKD